MPSSQFGTMQKCLDDVLEDGGISDNGKVSSKAPSKQDYVGISLLKIDLFLVKLLIAFITLISLA